ncbi:MAG TPA: organic hydroperoxide resistance protein [Solirubrobacteraceae bacterium]|nr:organic hydroperoxide resistance protein [Solirubrobacteraceae bacterium]
MAKVVYTAEATVTGGREKGHGKTTDGALEVDLRPPTEGGGTNPEQLFAVGYAACFEGALGVAARRAKAEVGDASIDSKVSLITTEDRGFNVAVTLDVTLPQVQDAEQAKEIVAAAHQICPYSNATRGNVEVTLTANGQAVG